MSASRFNRSVLVRQDAVGLKIYLHAWVTEGKPYAKLVVNLGSLAQFDIKFDLSELTILAQTLAELFNAYHQHSSADNRHDKEKQ